MPIPTRCPACGHTAMVYEQYAGQSIPCQSCGKPMVVPGVGAAPAAPVPIAPASGSGTNILLIVLAVVCGVLLLCGGGLVALLLPAINAAREAANRNTAANRIKMINLAIINHESATNRYPPAVVRDANGKPLYSGFVLLLPYLEEKILFNQFKKDEPWDSAHNLPLSQRMLTIFHDPSSSETTPYRTDFDFVTGPGTMFEELENNRGPQGNRGLGGRDVVDGFSNTIMIVDVKGNRRSWAEPGGWDASRIAPPVEGNHPSVVLAGFADGHMEAIPSDLPAAGWKALTSRNGREPTPVR